MKYLRQGLTIGFICLLIITTVWLYTLPPKKDPSLSWELNDLVGNKVDFADLSGKVVFINVWATWCPPCVDEMPSLNRLYNELKSEAVFIFVSLDDDPIVLRTFAEQHHLEIPIFYTSKPAPASLQILGYPTTFIIDKRGQISYKVIGYKDWDSDTHIRKFIKDLNMVDLGVRMQ